MSKKVYSATSERLSFSSFLPWKIIQRLCKYRLLIVAGAIQDFKATYQASHLGLIWQLLLPLMMLGIFYFVFGIIMGGRFSNIGVESPSDYAIALFIGLSVFNCISQVITSSTNLIISNSAFVKTLSYPLEILSVNLVLNYAVILVINIFICVVFVIALNFKFNLSTLIFPFYLICILFFSIGLSWLLSSLGAFIRDISVITSPITIILMFMCPIFYPLSMVPEKIRWVVAMNPLAMIIEGCRNGILYGTWPTYISMLSIFLISMMVFSFGYLLFLVSKPSFADVV